MFSFSKLGEVITDPRDVGPMTSSDTNGSVDASTSNGDTAKPSKSQSQRSFVEITLDTPLRALSRFFQWNSAAVVTEREGEEEWMKPVAVVTKVDLLGWLVRQGKVNGSS